MNSMTFDSRIPTVCTNFLFRDTCIPPLLGFNARIRTVSRKTLRRAAIFERRYTNEHGSGSEHLDTRKRYERENNTPVSGT